MSFVGVELKGRANP